MNFQKESQYCENCTYSSDVVNGLFSVSFEGLTSSGALHTFDGTDEENLTTMDVAIDTGAKFGRVISVKAEASGVNDVINVSGFDYLMQPMTEKFTLNGTTGVNGKKAFKIITKCDVPGGHKVTISTTNNLGLPFRTVKVLAGTNNGVVISTLPTLTAPIMVKQTATTGDPRGTVSVSDEKVVLVCLADQSSKEIDEEIVGGLFGLRHYAE